MCNLLACITVLLLDPYNIITVNIVCAAFRRMTPIPCQILNTRELQRSAHFFRFR